MTGRRVKVLMLIDNLKPGGAQALLQDVVSSMDPRIFEVVVCSLRRTGQRMFDPPQGCRILELKGGRFSLPKVWSLYKFLRKEGFDVIHAHLTASNILGVVLGRLAGVGRIFTHDHSGDEYLHKCPWLARHLLYPLERMVLSRSDTVFAVSEAIRGFNIDGKKIPAEKVVTIPNWIDTSRFSSPERFGRRFREELGIPSDALVIGSVGRLSEQKGYRHLLAAAPDIRRACPRAVLVVAGEGESRNELEALAERLGVADMTFFPGFVREVESVYPSFDLFVLPSLYEPFGLVVLEAMVSGVPVVATRVGGVPEIIIDRETGLLVEPGDPHGLARAVIELIRKPDLRERLATAARDMLGRKFDRSASIARILAFYPSERPAE